MPMMESYAPGTFCWADLGTPDAGAAKRFYTALFGWTAEDRPMGPTTFYTMLTHQGRAVAALYQQDPGSGAGTPRWLNYISVESANDTARRTRELGGAVVVEPFDVLDVGRMALVQDATGAVVALWQPRRHVGAGIIGETGAMCWNELATTDTARAEVFFAALFGWSAMTRDLVGLRYTTFARDGEPCGGMIPIDASRDPELPHWLVYFAVSDCDGHLALAQSLGGSVRVSPLDVPGVGRYAVLIDPQGATFAILQKAARR
jgi:uncharacterized protein